MNFKKAISIIACMAVTAASVSGCASDLGALTSAGGAPATENASLATTENTVTRNYAGLSAEEITDMLTLEEKAAQMSMAPSYAFYPSDIVDTDYGAVIVGGESDLDQASWRALISDYERNALQSGAAVPMVFGFDAVHGVGGCKNAVVFPHNIGIGAANDPTLTYEMGLAVADEMKLCGAYWVFSPCVAQAVDPRWGRTYESYSTDLGIIKSLSLSYMKGNIDGGIMTCPKHFFGDGNVRFGTGEGEYIIDRGDAELTDAEAAELLAVYKELIDAGAPAIMLSHSSVNGVKMHENKKYIDILKYDLGFNGIVLADWDAIDHTSGATRKEQVITSINAGTDMLMQMMYYDESRQYIIDGVNEGLISEERIDDAVTRIIRAKISIGLFDNTQSKPGQTEVGSEQYRALARQLVEKSQVLVKNEGELLPLKTGTKVFITGPAADNAEAQCGGWTLGWRGSADVPGVVTIKDALVEIAPSAGIEIVDSAAAADIVLLVIGETAYAEYYGDSSDISITGELALPGNAQAIEDAKNSEKPVAALIIAGRNVIISDYVDDWDAVVMGYLPGSEGLGVANVLTGKAPFTGKLPMPWYESVSQIGTDSYWLPAGYSAGEN
jgi:beta-glucosidase